MPFKKGKSGNPDGRPTGAENKERKELREAITKLLQDNYERFADAIMSLDNEKLIDKFILLLEYATPKLNRTDLTNNGESFDFSIDGTTAINRFNKIVSDFNRADTEIAEATAN